MDVTVVGSCNMDLLSYIPHLPQKGQTIHGSKFKTGFGGKGANQCVMSALLGAKTAMVAKVGKDSYGVGFKNEFKRHNINVDYIFETDEASTGVAPCLVGDKGESAIIIISGANLLLNPDEIHQAASLISQSKVMICQLEVTEDATYEALKLAKSHNVMTIFNPAPHKSDLRDSIFDNVDVFCPNETEACEVPINSVEEAGPVAQSYLEKGCKTVIITLGSLGVVFVTQEDKNPKHISCPVVNAIDTTGAGDCFVGSLAYFISNMPQLSWDEKIQRSVQIASDSVTREGTQTSFPSRDMVPHDLLN